MKVRQKYQNFIRGTLTNWVKCLSTNKKFQKSNIILEGFRHPNFMNPFEYGQSFIGQSFPKRFGTNPTQPQDIQGGHNVPSVGLQICSNRPVLIGLSKTSWIQRIDEVFTRHGIFQMFYTSEIPNPFQFSPKKKRVNRDIFGKKLRTEDVLLIFFEQIVIFCALSTPIQTLTSYFMKTLT